MTKLSQITQSHSCDQSLHLWFIGPSPLPGAGAPSLAGPLPSCSWKILDWHPSAHFPRMSGPRRSGLRVCSQGWAPPPESTQSTARKGNAGVPPPKASRFGIRLPITACKSQSEHGPAAGVRPPSITQLPLGSLKVSPGIREMDTWHGHRWLPHACVAGRRLRARRLRGLL